MKVLFTMTPAFDPNEGGVQRTTFKLGKYFTEKGIDVAYFSTSSTGHVEVDYGILFHGQYANGSNNLKNIEELKKILNSFQPDFVINQMPYEKKIREVLFQNKNKQDYFLLGCLRNSLFNFTSNARDRMEQMMPSTVFKTMDNSFGISIIKKRHRIKHRKDLKNIIDKHDKFILLAPPNRKELNYFVGTYKKEKVISIPNSIPKVFKNIKQKEKIILHVGRLNVKQKRSDLLLGFWEQVYAELPDWKFLIIGDGPYYESLEKDIQRKKLPRIELLGYQKPEPYYKKSTFFMMPSAYEGFPNTILEAQSHGCIPFAFDSYAALSWIVNDKKDSILSPAFETKHMAENLIRIAKDQHLKNKMIQASFENAERFTIDKVGQIWLDLFKNLKDNKSYKA